MGNSNKVSMTVPTISGAISDLFRFYLEVEEEFTPVLTAAIAAQSKFNDAMTHKTGSTTSAMTKTPKMLRAFLAGR